MIFVFICYLFRNQWNLQIIYVIKANSSFWALYNIFVIIFGNLQHRVQVKLRLELDCLRFKSWFYPLEAVLLWARALISLFHNLLPYTIIWIVFFIGYAMNCMFVSPQNSFVETLIPNVSYVKVQIRSWSCALVMKLMPLFLKRGRGRLFSLSFMWGN